MGKKYVFKSTASNAFSDDRWPRRVLVECDVTQDVANNASIINWTVKVDGTDSNAYAYLGLNNVSLKEYTYKNGSVGYHTHNFNYLYGPTVATAGDYIRVKSQAVIRTGSFTVAHNTDGSSPLCYRIEIEGWLSENDGGTNYIMEDSSNGYFILDVVPRTSTITCTTVEIGRNPTIFITAPSSTFKHTLRYKFGSLTGTIDTNIGPGSYNGWSIPTSFLNEIEDSVYGEGTIYCDTYSSSGTLNGTTSTTFRVNIPSTYGPNISPVIKDSSHASKLLTGDENKIIQYFNTVTYDIGAFTSTGAYIKEYHIACGGKTANTSSGTLKNVESNAFTISVTDSRGFTTTQTFYKTLVPYIKLTAKLQLVSIDTNGSGSVSISGNMFRGSFGVVDNEPVISYRWKAQSSSQWSDWTSLVYNITNDSYYTEVEFQNLDYQETYLFEAKAVDQLMTVETEQLVVKCMPVFDWNNDDFQFNVPVIVNGDLVVTGNVTSANNPEAMADFVVDEGVSNGWTWRKWNSGIAECWCKKSVSAAISTAWGSLFTSGALSASNLTLPFTFADVPTINVTVTNNGAGVFLMASGSWAPPSATATGAFELVRAVSSTTTNSYGLNYNVNGRWK